MNKYQLKVVVSGLCLMALGVQAAPPTITQQVTPGTISYQGRVQDQNGTDYVDGIYDIEFRLYDHATAGQLLWGATYKPYLKNGYFSVILGQTGVGQAAITNGTYKTTEELWKAIWVEPSTNANTDRYLGITVAKRGADDIVGAQESFPRQQLLASPFAIQAQFAHQATYAETTTGDFTIPTANKLNFSGGNGTIESGGTQINVNDDLNVTGSVIAPRVITAHIHNNGADVSVGWNGSPEDLLVWGNQVLAKNLTGYGYAWFSGDFYAGGNAVVSSNLTVGGSANVSSDLTVGRDLKASSIMPRTGDYVDVGKSSENKNLTVWGRVNAKSLAIIDSANNVKEPLVIRSYQQAAGYANHVMEKDTTVGTAEYSAIIAGFDGGISGINEYDLDDPVLNVMAYQSGGTWWIRAESSTEINTTPPPVWTVHVMFIRKELVSDERTHWGQKDRP